MRNHHEKSKGAARAALSTSRSAAYDPSVDADDDSGPMNPSVREQLVIDHMPVVNQVAYRMWRGLPSHVERADLVSAGTVGLLQSIDRYDPSRKVPLGAYCRIRVQGAILDYLRSLDCVPRQGRKRGLESPKFVEADAENLVLDPVPLIDETLLTREKHRQLREAVSGLPRRSRQAVVESYWGGRSLGSIGLSLGCTEAGVSRIRTAAVRALAVVLAPAA